MRRLGVRNFPLFQNMGLVIRQNLHKDSKGGVRMNNCFGDLTVQKVSKF